MKKEKTNKLKSAFGMWKNDKEKRDVKKYLDKLRKGKHA
jgi:hypothetical protein